MLFPDLSSHRLTFPPFSSIVELSDASNHNAGDKSFTSNAVPSIGPNVAVTLVGAGNTYYMTSPGQTGTTITGSPFTDGAKPSYEVTIDSDKIYDLNGNKMAEDYVFTFTDDWS